MENQWRASSGSGVVTLVTAMLVTGVHCLLDARHCTTYFTCVISFNPHMPVRKYRHHLHFKVEGREAEIGCTGST